jgi:hypothetical protein
VVELVVAETAKRERERKKLQKRRVEGLVFSRLWTRFSPLSDPEIHLYL